MRLNVPKPLVSVIIPTYNHRNYILDALNSVFAQTFTDYEIILVNDGSPDDTAERLKPLADSGKIIYIEQKNQGQASARNRGIAGARGDFIAFLDDDDLWPTDKLEWQVHHLQSRPDLGMVGGSCVIFEKVIPRLDGQDEDIRQITFESLFRGNPFHSPGQTLIRSSALQAVGGFDSTIWGTEDLELYMRLARTVGVDLSARVALFYRVHPNNASKALGRMMSNGKRAILKNLPHVPSERREKAEDDGFAWLYEYSCRPLVESAKQEFKAGRVLNGLRQLLKLRVLSGQILRRPQMVRRFFYDFTPVRWRRNQPGQPAAKASN